MTTKQTTNITDEQYKTLRAKYDNYHAARKQLCGNSNCVTAEQSKLLPPDPTHDEISSIEVYEFRHDNPVTYFAYVDSNKDYVTTWTGEILGEITRYGREYHNNMGDVRVNISVLAITGKHYTGTFYKSAGDYCRLKMIKEDI